MKTMRKSPHFGRAVCRAKTGPRPRRRQRPRPSLGGQLLDLGHPTHLGRVCHWCGRRVGQQQCKLIASSYESLVGTLLLPLSVLVPTPHSSLFLDKGKDERRRQQGCHPPSLFNSLILFLHSCHNIDLCCYCCLNEVTCCCCNNRSELPIFE